MTKLRATRAQVIAAAVIAVLAIVLGVVGLYGLNARGSESGAQVLEDMRLQAILNTAGSGAVDAYVAAAKSEASTKARESGGGMSAVREAAAKAEEEARAKAEELGIGAVDLTEIDTEPMSAALDVLLAAQRAYFAEEASAQAAYAAQAAQSAPADDAAAAADDTAEDDLTMEEEPVDLSGFVATEAMNRLSAEADDAYGALCGQIKAVFPALTDDVLATLKPTITGIVAVQNDRFELQYDRALAASGMNPGLNGVILREAYTMAVSAFGLLILAAAVLFYIPLVAKMGVPRLIIGLFFILLCLLAMILGLSLPSQLSNTLVRLGMNGVLVLAMLPGIQCGISLNLGLPIGIIGGLIGGLLCIEFGMSGFTGLFFAIAVGLVIAAATGWLYGLLLNRLKGSEMSVTTYVGFSVVSLMCIAWLVLPFKSPIMKWPLGNGLRTTIGLQTSYRHVLNDFLSFEIFGVTIPTGLLLFFAACCLVVWLFMRSKTGIAMSAAAAAVMQLPAMKTLFSMVSVPMATFGVVALLCLFNVVIMRTRLGQQLRAVGQSGVVANAAGIDVDRVRIIAIVFSTILAGWGQLIFVQNMGSFQTYGAHEQVGLYAGAAILVGGASVIRATNTQALVGCVLFHLMFILAPAAGKNLFGDAAIGEYFRVFICYGVIALSLVMHAWSENNRRKQAASALRADNKA